MICSGEGEKRNYQEHENASFSYLPEFSKPLPMWLVTTVLFVPVGKRSNSRSQMLTK